MKVNTIIVELYCCNQHREITDIGKAIGTLIGIIVVLYVVFLA